MWTGNFKRVCFSALLMFVSQYMLLPTLPLIMADRLGFSIARTGSMFLVFTLGMLLISPFSSYLVDTFQRKKLCVSAFTVLLITTAAYTLVNRPPELVILPLIQGMAFGITSSAFITLGIDMTSSAERSRGNVVFGWFTRMGMIAGIALGSAVYLNYGFEKMVITSIAIGFAGLLLLVLVRVPFRAPIGSKLLTLDRFFLPRSWVLVINMILISLVPGILFPLIHFKIRDTFFLYGWGVPYFLVAAVGFLFSVFLVRAFSEHENRWKQVVIGLVSVVLAISLLILFYIVPGQILSAILLGAGLGIVTPALLLLFIDLSSHCERITANYTYLLSWEIGVSGGVALSCYLREHAFSGTAFQVSMFIAALALIFFIVAAFPYYLKKKVR